jgi:hypothetical protein
METQQQERYAGRDISQRPTKWAEEDILKAVPTWPTICQHFSKIKRMLHLTLLWLSVGILTTLYTAY